MTGRHGFRRLFGRSKPVPVLDPVGYRLPPRAPLASPPPSEPTVAPLPARAPEGASTVGPRGPQVRLVMADGTVAELPVDPELEERAAYLVRSMLPPAPPPPRPSSGR